MIYERQTTVKVFSDVQRTVLVLTGITRKVSFQRRRARRLVPAIKLDNPEYVAGVFFCKNRFCIAVRVIEILLCDQLHTQAVDLLVQTFTSEIKQLGYRREQHGPRKITSNICHATHIPTIINTWHVHFHYMLCVQISLSFVLLHIPCKVYLLKWF